jgi:alkyl sulfatase BDS1-like metallo-beta-lactamase superfamily hydrolase
MKSETASTKTKLEPFKIIKLSEDKITEDELTFDQPRKDVYCARMTIAGCGWVDTGEGVVLIDTLLNRKAAAKTREQIHKTGGPIRTIIYTHGHLDHINGCIEFMGDDPEVIASQYLPDRLDKYKMLARHRVRISSQQFNIPESLERLTDWVYPTKTFLGEYTFRLGNKTFELHTDRAETDDVVWVWIPEIKTAFIGDLMISGFPNVGNPWKPTRFALDWIKTLEKIRAKKPDSIFYGGANRDLHGQEAITALGHNIEAIRCVHDQVVDLINQDVHITEMIHQVKIPEDLQTSPYLNMNYSRTEFMVYNIYRWYHGYFDHNPAHLLPRPETEVCSEIFDLIGNADRVLDRARSLMNQGQAQLGLQVLDILLQAQPDNRAARSLRIEILEKIGGEDTCLMSRNTWVYFIEKDREFLAQHPDNR